MSSSLEGSQGNNSLKTTSNCSQHNTTNLISKPKSKQNVKCYVRTIKSSKKATKYFALFRSNVSTTQFHYRPVLSPCDSIFTTHYKASCSCDTTNQTKSALFFTRTQPDPKSCCKFNPLLLQQDRPTISGSIFAS